MEAVVLAGVTSMGIDESTSKIGMDGWEEGELGLTVSGLDDPCFAFFPRRLGRFPKSSILGKVFLLSPTERRGWN